MQVLKKFIAQILWPQLCQKSQAIFQNSRADNLGYKRLILFKTKIVQVYAYIQSVQVKKWLLEKYGVYCVNKIKRSFFNIQVWIIQEVMDWFCQKLNPNIWYFKIIYNLCKFEDGILTLQEQFFNIQYLHKSGSMKPKSNSTKILCTYANL